MTTKWHRTKSLSTIQIIVMAGCLSTGLPALASPSPQLAPALNPPHLEKKEPAPPLQQVTAKGANQEWTFHKSSDGSHPDGNEQQMLWLMNRARNNPAQEGEWLASESDPDVAGGRDFFGVNLTMLRSEFAAIANKPPAAFDIRLYNAAYAHSLDLIARDAQDHTGQFDRVTAAGFHYSSARGNVFSYADSGLNAHAAFNIDWGGTEGGMQAGRGHRQAIMSMDGEYSNVGLAAIAELNAATDVGPLVVTGNFAQAATAYPDHFNIFLVGTVWRDSNDNGEYDPGEGLGGVSVHPGSGAYYAVTGNSGGYAIPISTGTYTVTFSGGAMAGSESVSVSVNGKSALLDLIVPPASTVINRSSLPWLLLLLRHH